MKSKNALLLLAILFTVQLLFSENSNNLFDNFLPDHLKKNPTFLKSIQKNLQTYASIDPDLIYFYLKTLETPQEEDSSAEIWRNVFQKKLSRAKYLQKEWAKMEQTAIKNQITPSVLAKKISSFYDKYDYTFVHQITVEQDIKVDENKLNFFKYIYLSGDSVAKFDSNKNYEQLFLKTLQQKVNTLNQKFDQLKEASTKQEIAQFLIQANRYPFIFKNTYLESIPITTNFHLYQFLEASYKRDFLNKNSIYFQLAGNGLAFSVEESFKTTDPFDSHYKYDFAINIRQIIYLFAGFKLKLKEEFQPFSFINFAVGIPVGTIYSNTFKDVVLFDGIKAISGLRYVGSYQLNNIREIKSKSIVSQITFPVYYYSDKIFFEVGLNYSLINVSYKYDFIKDGEVTHPYTPDPPDYYLTMQETISKNSTHHLLYPMISTNFYIRKNLNLRVDYLIPLQGRIALSYYLNF